MFPPHNFESDHKGILAISETIERKYTIEKEMNCYFREYKVSNGISLTILFDRNRDSYNN